MPEISPLIFYGVPSHIKLRLNKYHLYEDFTNGLMVYEYNGSECISGPKSANLPTFYETLFDMNVITIISKDLNEEKYILVGIDDTVDENTFDIYIVDIENGNNSFYRSTKDKKECKEIVDSLIDKEYYIFIPGKYLEIAGSE